jgi:hypothetical protein
VASLAFARARSRGGLSVNGAVSRMRALGSAVVAVAILAGCGSSREPNPFADPSWRHQFGLSNCSLASAGRNPYLVLEPGYQLILEGGSEKLAITVLRQTKDVAGVTTRVVEEREWKDGELIEVSRNFFAICPATEDVFYFGEEVDDIDEGEVVGHAGAWLAGEKGARAGLIMPGDPKVGMKYYQEVAPDVALDRAEIVSVDETVDTPAGTFSDCVRTEEGTALDTSEREAKSYAPGIGLIQEEDLLLTRYGSVGSG